MTLSINIEKVTTRISERQRYRPVIDLPPISYPPYQKPIQQRKRKTLSNYIAGWLVNFIKFYGRDNLLIVVEDVLPELDRGFFKF